MAKRSQYPEVKVIFVFGTSEKPNKREKRKLIEESKENCDVIQLNFIDAYENVTLDSVFALRLAQELDYGKPKENNPSYKGNPEFILIGDDDSYISLPRLWRKCFNNENVSCI